MKLNFNKVFFVGMAFFLITMFWQTYDAIITKILIDKFGLNQTWSGVVMAFDNVLALFLLPLFGGISDRTNSKYGRRTPYIVVGTVLAAFAFVSLSFADNYQTTRITEQTSIIENYESVLEEKAVMLGSILSSGETAKARALAKGDITQAEYDTWLASWTGYIAKWNETNAELVIEKVRALSSDEITQRQYNRWYKNAYIPLNESAKSAIQSGGLTQQQYSYWSDEIYDGVYDANLSSIAWNLTKQNPATFIIFVMMLFIALVSMSVFRSPAVALMPDVTIKPLRSKANAIINLLGTFGGILSIAILAIYGLDSKSYVDYTPAFVTIGILMIVILLVFLWKVREPKLVQERIEDDIKYGIESDEVPDEDQHSFTGLSKEKQTSLYLILISVFLWFIGYNAVTTKLSDYAPKVLGMGFAMPLLIAQGAALIAFIPIGIIATKIGRRKTVLIGIVVLSVCFGSVYLINENTGWLLYIIFGFTGIGWATINVNSYPMVVELSKGSNVGKYTGYYYTFSMSAQILTPILSGILMDQFGRKILFPYATLFVALAFVTMFLVKHGDAKIIKKESIIENFDVDMD